MFRLPWSRGKTKGMPKGEQTLDLTNALGVGSETLAPEPKSDAERTASAFLSEIAIGDDGMIVLPVTIQGMIGMGGRMGVEVAFSDHGKTDDTAPHAPYVRLGADGNGGMTIDLPKTLSAPICRRTLMMLLVCIYSGDVASRIKEGKTDIPLGMFNINAAKRSDWKDMMMFADYASAAIIAPKAFIAGAFRDGWSLQRIGDVLDVTYDTVCRICSQMGMDHVDTEAEAAFEERERKRHLDGPQSCKWSPLGYMPPRS